MTGLAALALPAVPAAVLVAALAIVLVGLANLRSDPVKELDVDDLVLLRETRREEAAGLGLLDRLAQPLVPLILRLMGAGLQLRLKRMIELAGRPQGIAVDTVVRRAAVWALLMAPVVAMLLALGYWYAAVPAGGLAVVLPLATLARTRRVRQETISRELPDFLDILAVTVNAGVGFRQGLATISERFGGPVAEEVTLTLEQIRNGASLREAFRRLQERNDSAQLSSFVTAFLQAEELGAPLAQILNRIAADMRRESAQRQRRLAGQVSPRVTLVSSLIILPGALALLGVGFFLGSDIDLGPLVEQVQ
ncbi:MAG: type II secretion system F family protein [Kineosporiaceae bacterium]